MEFFRHGDDRERRNDCRSNFDRYASADVEDVWRVVNERDVRFDNWFNPSRQGSFVHVGFRRRALVAYNYGRAAKLFCQRGPLFAGGIAAFNRFILPSGKGRFVGRRVGVFVLPSYVLQQRDVHPRGDKCGVRSLVLVIIRTARCFRLRWLNIAVGPMATLSFCNDGPRCARFSRGTFNFKARLSGILLANDLRHANGPPSTLRCKRVAFSFRAPKRFFYAFAYGGGVNVQVGGAERWALTANVVIPVIVVVAVALFATILPGMDGGAVDGLCHAIFGGLRL